MTELMQRAAPPDVIFYARFVLAHNVITRHQARGMQVHETSQS